MTNNGKIKGNITPLKSAALGNSFLISIFLFQIRDRDVFSDGYTAGFHVWIQTIATKGEGELLHRL